MNTIQRILKNTGVLLFSNVVRKVFTFFYILFMARHLGTTGFGIFTFAVGFTEIFVFITDFGLNTLTVKEVARDKSLAKKYLGNISLIKLFSVILFWAVMALAVNLLGYPDKTVKVVYLFAFHIVIRTFSNMLYALFQAYEKMEYQSLGGIFTNALTLFGVLFAISQNFDVIGFALIYVIVSVFDLLYAAILCAWKFVLPKLEVDLNFWKESLKHAWPLGTTSVFFIIYFKIDIVMLSLMKSDLDVGLYGAAFRLSEVLIVFPLIFMSSIFPVLSSYYKKSTSSFKVAYEKSIKYLFSLALPIALAGTLLAPKIIDLVYGKEFAGSVSPFQVLVWASAIMYVTIVQGGIFIAADRQIPRMKIFAMAVILNIALNLIVIPKYSYIGASLTTVFTEAFTLILGAFLLNKYGYKLNFIHTWLIPFFGLSVAAIAIFPLSLIYMNVVKMTIICLLIYSLIIFLIGIRKDDKFLLKFVLSR